MNAQLQSALLRGLTIAGAVVLTGLVALIPQLTGTSPINTAALIRVFVVAVITALAARFLGEGIYDKNRAAAVKRGDMKAINRADIGPQLVIPGQPKA
jgi:hypothetical protein